METNKALYAEPELVVVEIQESHVIMQSPTPGGNENPGDLDI